MDAKVAVLVAALAAVTLAGCDTRRPPADKAADGGLQFFVRNETDRDVVILVDGVPVLSVASGVRLRDELVVLPYRHSHTVVTQSSTGHVFGSFTTAETAWFGAPGFVKNTRCGDIWVWVGRDVSAEIAPVQAYQQEPCD